MIQDFESWIQINKIGSDVIEAFRESIMCYRVCAYKSAYLMAYIGMQSIFRDSILNTDVKSPYIPDSMWNTIKSKLLDDDEWDKMVSECVNQKKPDRVFLMTDSIVKQYEALRSIRNICAHGKTGKVGAVQVEFLWDFIISNNHLFVINGGVDGIRQMIDQFYDRTVTPPDSDPSDIIKNIQMALHGSDLQDFIDWLYIESQKRDHIAGPCFDERNKYIGIWDRLYECTGEIRELIIDYVKEKHFEELVYFVNRYESSIDDMMIDPVVVRKLWTDSKMCNGFNTEGAWRILYRLITGSMVPDKEKDLFYKNLFNSVPRWFPEDKIELLEKTDYFERYRKAYIYCNNYNQLYGGIINANENSRYFIRYVKLFGLETESVRTINHILSFATYGSFYDAIVSLLKDEKYIEQYKRICLDSEFKDYSEKINGEENEVGGDTDMIVNIPENEIWEY